MTAMMTGTTFSPAPTTWAQVEQNFARHLPNYEPRVPQQTMAIAIEEAMIEGRHLLCQAGCGTGKSLGGVTPALLQALEQKTRVIVATATKALQEQYCVAPETKVLTADLHYIRADEAVVGMDLVGFDEERVGNRRRYRTATVESTEIIQRPCYRLTFDDGTVVTASSEHKWLTRRGMGVQWMTTEALCVQAGARNGSNVIRLFDTWSTDTSYEAGYLAAAWDGEGHLTQTESQQLENGVINKLSFAQRNNEMHTQVQQYLAALGFKYTERIRTEINATDINTRPEMVRFLGQVRTARLLPKFRVEGLGTLNVQRGARLISKEFVGMQDVVAMQTSTGTFVAEGLASHNCTKDIPFLEEHSGIRKPNGEPFTWALVKGRSNYACQAKLNSVDNERNPVALAVKAEIEADETHDGDREHFATEIDDREWGKLASSSNECPGKSECPFGAICFAEKIKEAGAQADLVITNQAMLMTDLVIREKTSAREQGPVAMLGDYGMVLFDEGHELPEYAASALGNDFTGRGMGILAKDVNTFASLNGQDLQHRQDEMGQILDRLGNLLIPMCTEEDRRGNKTYNPVAVTLRWFTENFEDFADLNDLLGVMRTDLQSVRITEDQDRQNAKRKMLQTRVTNAIASLEEMMLSADEDRVRWIEVYEVRNEAHWKIRVAPVQVGPWLKSNLWDQVPSVVMSATLSAGVAADGSKDFSYIKRTLGLWDNVSSVDVGTPFNFGEQGLMFVPGQNIPNPKDRAAWMAWNIGATLELIDMAKGGALLLFTSRTAMKASYEALSERLDDRGLTTLMQGDGRTNKELARIFKEDQHSVLFALKSFFVGVDVPGEACRLVIIDKMPFPVPSDPVFKARSLAEERAGRRPFSTLSIPMMTLTLEQGVGRLIRSKEDRGVVALMDSRLSATPYGRSIVSALPDFPVTTKLSDVDAFYGGKSFGR